MSPNIVETTEPTLKETLLNQIAILEVKADHYCRTDRERYDSIRAELKDLDAKLLAIYDEENIAWLNKKEA